MDEQKSSLTGLAVVVVTAASGPGSAIAAGLARAGAQVVTVGDGDLADIKTQFESRQSADATFAATVNRLGKLDALIYAVGIPGSLRMRTLDQLTDAEWKDNAEQPVKQALLCLQAAFPHLVRSHGRVAMVLPTLGMSGAPGMIAASTAIEGLRNLTKVVARQWGRHGVTANCLATAPELSSPEMQSDEVLAILKRASFMGSGDVGSSLPAGHALNLERTILPLVAFLAAPTGGLITGETIVADGGVWMVP